VKFKLGQLFVECNMSQLW